MKNSYTETTISHHCPRCHQPTVCEIEQGKSSCWCFEEPRPPLSDIQENISEIPGTEDSEECLCRQCLKEALSEC